ncbi:MAG: hypothetical protein ACI97A_002124 [Planctomycetota bacterium]|jgi:hypothetical protein
MVSDGLLCRIAISVLWLPIAHLLPPSHFHQKPFVSHGTRFQDSWISCNLTTSEASTSIGFLQSFSGNNAYSVGDAASRTMAPSFSLMSKIEYRLAFLPLGPESEA